jgi:hypothetical protein
MELTPSRTAVIAVHMQHDIINADGGFGGFFAAQAAERDVIGQGRQLLDAARRPAPPSSTPRRLAAGPPGPGRQLAAAGHGRAVAPGRGSAKAEIVPSSPPRTATPS